MVVPLLYVLVQNSSFSSPLLKCDTPQVLEEQNLSSNNNFPLQDLQLFQQCHTVWADNPKFYNLRVMFSDLSIAVQIPKRASVSLENQLRLKFLGVRCSFFFIFFLVTWPDKPVAPPIEVQWQRADKMEGFILEQKVQEVSEYGRMCNLVVVSQSQKQ